MNCLKRLKNLFILLIYLVIYEIVISIFKIGCPIKFFTGIPCAGCGMSRAWLSMLFLDIRSALHYHPLFWIPPVAAIIYVFMDYIKPSILRTLTAVTVILFIVVYLYRVFIVGDAIVAINFHDGLIYRVIKYFGDVI